MHLCYNFINSITVVSLFYMMIYYVQITKFKNSTGMGNDNREKPIKEFDSINKEEIVNKIQEFFIKY